jgi:hypothetical protein
MSSTYLEAFLIHRGSDFPVAINTLGTLNAGCHCDGGTRFLTAFARKDITENSQRPTYTPLFICVVVVQSFNCVQDRFIGLSFLSPYALLSTLLSPRPSGERVRACPVLDTGVRGYCALRNTLYSLLSCLSTPYSLLPTSWLLSN